MSKPVCMYPAPLCLFWVDVERTVELSLTRVGFCPERTGEQERPEHSSGDLKLEIGVQHGRGRTFFQVADC